jgi:hypothetical protein
LTLKKSDDAVWKDIFSEVTGLTCSWSYLLNGALVTSCGSREASWGSPLTLPDSPAAGWLVAPFYRMTLRRIAMSKKDANALKIHCGFIAHW